jgi:hypothetical protein
MCLCKGHVEGNGMRAQISTRDKLHRNCWIKVVILPRRRSCFFLFVGEQVGVKFMSPFFWRAPSRIVRCRFDWSSQTKLTGQKLRAACEYDGSVERFLELTTIRLLSFTGAQLVSFDCF